MKQHEMLKSLFFIFLFSLGLAACKKDSGSADGAMSAKIDGKSWNAKTVGAQVLPGLINITGQSSDGKTITITVQSGQAGQYLLDEFQDHAAVYLESSGSLGFASNGPDGVGYVNITEINEENSTISGTFEFNGIRATDSAKREIREGTFSGVKFEKQVSTAGPSTLSCKINGQSFAPASVVATAVSSKIFISANSADLNKTIGLTVPQDIAVGEFNLTSFGDYTGQYNLNQSQFMGADSGKIKITKHDKATHQLEGTFHYEASDFQGTVSASITDGTFKVSY